MLQESLHIAILSPFLLVQMNLRSIKWGLAIPCGWLVILVSAAIFLPSAEAIRFAPQVLALVIVWLLLTAVALGFYFYRAWRRLPLVPNKGVYAARLSLQTACGMPQSAFSSGALRRIMSPVQSKHGSAS